MYNIYPETSNAFSRLRLVLIEQILKYSHKGTYQELATYDTGVLKGLYNQIVTPIKDLTKELRNV